MQIASEQSEVPKYFMGREHSDRLCALGFNEDCFGYWSGEYFVYTVDRRWNRNEVWLSEEGNCVSSPLREQALDFIEREYGLYCMVNISTRDGGFYFEIKDSSGVSKAVSVHNCERKQDVYEFMFNRLFNLCDAVKAKREVHSINNN